VAPDQKKVVPSLRAQLWTKLAQNPIKIGSGEVHAKLVGFGYSHISALDHASTRLANRIHGLSIDTTLLLDPELPPVFRGHPRYGIEFTREFARYVSGKAADADIIFLYVASNAHQIFGLVNHSVPFDFVLEEAPDLALQPEHEIVPSRLVREAMANQGGFPESIRMLRAFDAFFRDRIIVNCALPPIIPSRTHIEKYSGPFREPIEKNGVAPELVRYKIWRLHSTMLEEECEKLGIKTIPVPSSMIDENGFLAEAAWNPDATHTNERYGIKVIEQLAQLHDPAFSIAEPE
jgi:hypothetical protein